MVKRISEGSETSGWTLHDLRRTAASGMAMVGVPPQVVEKLLNHSSGVISGVALVYNRYGYGPEKREALENWCNHLEALEASDAPLFEGEGKAHDSQQIQLPRPMIADMVMKLVRSNLWSASI